MKTAGTLPETRGSLGCRQDRGAAASWFWEVAKRALGVRHLGAEESQTSLV